MKKLIASAAAILAFATSAFSQDTNPPSVTMTAPPTGIAVETDRVTVTGDANDDTAVTVVEYRIEGSRRWRRATLTNPDSSSTSYVFSYKNTKKGRAKRVYVRARDEAKNESDTLGRKIFRAR